MLYLIAKSVTEAATGQAVATTHTIFATESPGKKQSKMAVSIGITKSCEDPVRAINGGSEAAAKDLPVLLLHRLQS